MTQTIERKRILSSFEGPQIMDRTGPGAVEQRASTDYRSAFGHYLRDRVGADRSELLLQPGDLGTLTAAELRSQGIGSLASGGFWVADSFQRQLVLAANDASAIRRAAAAAGSLIATPTGSNVVYPTVDDTSVDGVLVAEDGTSPQTDIATIGALVCPSYLLHSRALLVSWQFVNDAGPELEGYLAQVLGRRVARRENTAYTLGAGADEPQGLVPAASVQVTAAAVASITSDELEQLIESADDEWRFSPSARWLMGSATFHQIRRLKDSTGRYLVWSPAAPEQILGVPVVISKDMPALASGNRTVVYYDASRFVIRDVVPAGLTVLRQLYARNAQVGYLMFQRHGSVLQSVGAVPAAVCIQQA